MGLIRSIPERQRCASSGSRASLSVGRFAGQRRKSVASGPPPLHRFLPSALVEVAAMSKVRNPSPRAARPYLLRLDEHWASLFPASSPPEPRPHCQFVYLRSRVRYPLLPASPRGYALRFCYDCRGAGWQPVNNLPHKIKPGQHIETPGTRGVGQANPERLFHDNARRRLLLGLAAPLLMAAGRKSRPKSPGETESPESGRLRNGGRLLSQKRRFPWCPGK